MEYYPTYNGSTQDLQGIIHINDYYGNNATITIEDGSSIQLNNIAEINRALHLDKIALGKIEDTYYVNTIICRNEIKLVGILYLNSNIKYGFTKKNIPIYLFKPIDKKYPTFYVPSKNKLNKNVYAIISFSKWENDSKYPIGMCQEIIGEIGILENEYQHILWLYQLQYPNLNHKYKTIENIEIKPNSSRIDLRDLPIISIDPPNSKDIDDAIHLVELDKQHYQIGIHIADVSHFIKENSPLDLLVRQRLTSVYPPHKTINMLPNIYSDDICSLLPNKDRYSLSLLINTNKNGTITKYQFVNSIIHSKRAYSYLEANQLLEKNDKYLIDLEEISQKIWNKHSFEIKQDTSNRTGLMIQIFMILANHYAALTVKQYFPNTTILRTHQSVKPEVEVDLHPELNNYLYLQNLTSANYQISPEKTSHETLQLDYYTHFTSPIRRYVDILIHRCLKKIIKSDVKQSPIDITSIEPVIDTINTRNKMIKKAQRKWNKITLISNLSPNTITKAYIIDINLPKIEIFIPEYQVSINTRLFNRKLDKLLSYQTTDDTISITNNNTNQYIELKLYQEIEISLIPYLNKEDFNDKLDITIIQPVIYNLIEL